MNDQLSRLNQALSGRYTVQHEIGRGGMATVFLAQDVKHARPVALKVFDPEFAANLSADRFLREIKITAKLQHPHIVPLYDSGEADELLFYVMAYVEGESLRARLSHQRQLPLDAALQIAQEVAGALDYAHGFGVIHRDIKPENILLTRGHAMVADFGIAFGVRTAGGEALTRTGTAIGTPAYMSPEQATGAPLVDARSDIYSLGCVLYEMLAGLPPYVGPTPIAILAQQAVGKVKPPRQLRGDTPKAVERAVLKALASEPAERHTTAEEFSRTLVTPARGGTTGFWSRVASAKAIALGAGVLAVIVVGVVLVSERGGGATEAGLRAVREGGELHFRGLATGEPGHFEDAIARYDRAAELDTTLIATASLNAGWSHAMLGQFAEADSLISRVLPRRDRLSPGQLLSLDLLVAGYLRGDRAAALRVARQIGGIDLGVHAFRYNHPREAAKALEGIDPSISDYWYFLTASYHALGEHEAELGVARRGRLDQPDLLSRAWYEARALAALGRVDAVNELIDECLTFPPEPGWGGTQSSVMTAAATELRAHGNRAAAIKVAERAIDWLEARPVEQKTTRVHRNRLARANRLAERWDEARELFEQLRREFPDESYFQGVLGTLAARRGDRDEASRISASLAGMAGPYEFGVESYWQANIAALLGERERAVNLLRDAFAQGFPYQGFNPHADMDFEPLRDYPPYQELVRPKG